MRRNKKVVMGCLAAALILLMAALGIIALADAAPEYTASASTNLGESIALKVTPLTSKPSAWTMAWRVGATTVNTVSIGIQVQPTGTNVVNPRLTYYIKAVCGSNSKIVLSGNSIDVSLGSVFSNSTGSMSIDSHLQSLGVSTSQDQTVTYYIYAKLEAQGAVSGQTLVAEVQEQAFSTVLYDYGVETTTTIRPSYNNPIARMYSCSYITYDVLAPPVQPTGATQWSPSDYSKLGSSWVTTSISVTDDQYNYLQYIVVAHIIYTSVNNGTVFWYGFVMDWYSECVFVSRIFRIFKWTGNSWTLVETYVPIGTGGGWTRTLSAGTYAICFGVEVGTRNAGITYEAYINTCDVQVSYQTVNWSASWSWANQPLSLVAVPVARLMVTLSLLCFAGLILYAGRGSRISLAAALAFVLLAVLFGLGVAYAAEPQTVAPMPVPEKWRAGSLAIYLQSFPFPTYEYINGTAVEKPAEVIGDLMLSLAVFNATSDMPVLIKVDGQDVWQLCGEGFYSLQCSLSPGMHSIVVYCPIKIFEEAVFYVKPKPITPLMPLEEFLRRLEQQRNEIVTRSLAAAAAGVPVGYCIKRKTKIRTGWVLPLPCAMMVVGYWKMPDLYMLLFAGAMLFITYYLPFDFARRLVLARFKANNIDFDLKLPVDEDGEVIVGISPRYWRHGFIHKKRLEIVETLHDVLGSSLTTMTFDGKTYDCIILDPLKEKPVEHYPDRIVVYGRPALRAALLDSQVLEKVAEALKKALLENRVAKDLIDEMAEMGAIDLKSTLQSPLRQMLEEKIAEFTTVMVKNVEKPEVNGENENQT